MDQTRRQPNQQLLLQGSILDESVDILLHRLRGMCDDSEGGLVRYKEHEMVFTMREPVPPGTVSVRVKRQLNGSDQPWLLCYLGNPEVGDKSRLTTVRTCIEVNCSQNVCSFLRELGFNIDYEFINHGWIFRKNRLRVNVSKVCRILNPNNLDQVCPITKSHLIEVSTIASSGNDQSANEVHSFSEQLKPLVNLEKVDPRRLNA